MKTKTEPIGEIWMEGRNRFSTQIASFLEDELKKNGPPTQNR